ncbi:MAG: hypothetical protein BMS9Abin23_0653 [Thermodesulfobacteriota bacterium]|nr:MAG: hypothetical protein BMS9Abin23_0653 [Thermodesulfobacteriota bacterium]
MTMSEKGHSHNEESHNEELRKVSIMLEEDQIVLLKELAEEYRAKLGQRWSMSAVVRVAVGDFLSKMGRIS